MRSWVVIFSLSALSLASCDLFAQANLRGPYLNNVSSDAVTIIWETAAPTTGIVHYGVQSTAERMAVSSTPATHHEVRLTGLSQLAQPGGLIRYEVEIGSGRYGGTFRTTTQGRTPFSFIIYGDNRSSPQQHQVVIDALMRENNINFAINTGDLVSNGEDEADWDAFFPVANPFLAQTPLFVAIGNHEVDGGRWDVTRRLFDLPVQTPPASNDEGYYHVVQGNVELIVVNVEVDSLYTIGLLAGDQEAWLEQVLAQRPPGVDHRYLFIHQGPYSSKIGRNGNFWLRQWLDRLKMAGVDVIFSGHDHYAERGFAKNGIYYVIHGGGGAPLYNTQGVRTTNDHTIIHSETQLGYIRVDINGEHAIVTTKGIDGAVVDRFEYGNTAQPECTQPTDCGAPPPNGCPGGSWTCERSACHFACGSGSGSLFACATDNACESQIGATCAGTVSCERPSVNPLSWYCLCTLPPDCTMDTDCSSRPPPLEGCTGTWACVNQACEFTTDVCEPAGLDGGVSTDDAGSSDAGDQTPDAGFAPDAPAPIDSGLVLPDAAATLPDGGADPIGAPDSGATNTPNVPPSQESCGCTTTSTSPASPAWLLGFALFLAIGRASTRRARQRNLG